MVYCLFLLDLTDDMKWIVWSNAEVDLIFWYYMKYDRGDKKQSPTHPRLPGPILVNTPFK